LYGRRRSDDDIDNDGTSLNNVLVRGISRTNDDINNVLVSLGLYCCRDDDYDKVMGFLSLFMFLLGVVVKITVITVIIDLAAVNESMQVGIFEVVVIVFFQSNITVHLLLSDFIRKVFSSSNAIPSIPTGT
jgi:hypothetical protein